MTTAHPISDSSELEDSGKYPVDRPRATAEPPTLEHAGLLEDLLETPRYLMPEHVASVPQVGRLSCSFCGVGDGGTIERIAEAEEILALPYGPGTTGLFSAEVNGVLRKFEARALKDGAIEVTCSSPLVAPGAIVRGEFAAEGWRIPFMGRESDRLRTTDGAMVAHVFKRFNGNLSVYREALNQLSPTTGCIKLRHSMLRQRPAYPIHAAPSVLDRETGRRRAISYQEAIRRLAELLLAHRFPNGRTLLYASGQCDYFAVFAIQEVFRLLGVRNLTGNAEHCLNAGAVHNEILTGQEGPFLTIAQAINGPNRFYLFNGWNGFIAHPPVFKALTSRPDFDGYLIEVMVTESAKAIAERFGKERVLLIRPRTDPHIALAVAHEILTKYPEAVSTRFVERFGDPAAFERYTELARSERFAPERVAERCAAEPDYSARLLEGIRRIAMNLALSHVVPMNFPSMGLSQTSGAVAHCLWGSALALVGKYGLGSDGQPLGGAVRLPGQINAESEVQGLSRKYFMGRIPVTQSAEAARRMGLPEDAYERVLADAGRAALDYSDPTPDEHELFVCMGTQFEANMMGRKRWIEKLRDPKNTLVVIDPIPDSWSLEHAQLIIPSPPHPATTKLYQNGEWKLTLSIPQKRAPSETRSDATILYDVMAEIGRRVELDPELSAAHGDLARHVRSGYIPQRFDSPEHGGGLTRIDGEVSRPELWDRILEYMSGGCGPLYCRPEHADGRAIQWTEFLERGAVYYGGIGTTRYRLDYDDPNAQPYGDIYRRPTRFRFFTPTDADLEIPTGTIFNSGRSTLSDERPRVAFAIGTFNSGKATPIVGMPEETTLFMSALHAQKCGVANGQRVRMTNPDTGDAIELPIEITDRVKGDMVYASFHKTRAQMDRGVYINDVTSRIGRCPYTAQTSMKVTRVQVERASAALAVEPAPQVETARVRLNTTHIDPKVDLPIWSGRDTPLYVTEVIQETHNVYTFRFQGEPLCRFVYWPGQYCSFVLSIDGKKVIRSYSISSSPTRPYVLEVTVKRVPGGLVSNWLPDNLRVGDRVELAGPKGKFCLVPGKIPKKMLLLAAGSGVTPLMSMARWLTDVSADVDIKFFNSVQTPNDIVFHKELEMFAERYRTFDPVVVTSSRVAGSSWTGLRGRISKPMLDMVAPDLHERQVYMCGPEGFMEASRALLSECGFDIANLHAESFASARSVSDEAARGTNQTGSIRPTAEDAVTVEFARKGRRVTGSKKLTVLEIAEANGVELEYGCRAGNCGDCKIRVLSGDVQAASDSGISDAERREGFALSCVAIPTSDCVIDA